MNETDKNDVLLSVQEYIRQNVNSEDIDGLKQAIEKAMQDNYIQESERIAILEHLKIKVGVGVEYDNGKIHSLLSIWDKGGKCYSLVQRAIAMLEKKYTYMQHKTSVGGSWSDGVAVADSDAPTSKQQPTSKQLQQKERGRQVKPFNECLLKGNKQELLKMLHKRIDGKKGKEVGLVFGVLVNCGVISKPQYKQVLCEFGDIVNSAGYYKYLPTNMHTNDEIKGVKAFFSHFID